MFAPRAKMLFLVWAPNQQTRHLMNPSPSREQLQAVLLALLCSVMFLGSALIPGRALVPYPPELNAVEGALARSEGMSPDEL